MNAVTFTDFFTFTGVEPATDAHAKPANCVSHGAGTFDSVCRAGKHDAHSVASVR
jgi:hypothetical protein